MAYFHSRYSLKKSSNNWYWFECPYCYGGKSGEVSMAVNVNLERVKCWRAKCEKNLSVVDFVAEQESLTYVQAKNFIESFTATSVTQSREAYVKKEDKKREVEVKGIQLPYSFKLLLTGNTSLCDRAAEYVKSRGFVPEIWDSRGFGYCDQEHDNFKKNYFGYLIVPFYKRGRLVYYIGRDFLNRDPKDKYKNPLTDDVGVGKSQLFYNEDALITANELHLVEGFFCAETIGSNAVASLGWSVSPIQKSKLLRSKANKLIIGADKGAYKLAVKFGVTLIDYKDVYVVNFDAPELAPYGKDVNDVGLDRYMNAIDKTDKLTFGKAMKVLI